MSSLISDVRRPHQPTGAELAFQRQVPQIDRGQTIVLRENLVKRERALWECRVRRYRLVEPTEKRRKWIGHARTAIWVLKIHTGRDYISAPDRLVQVHDGSKWRDADHILKSHRIWDGVVDSRAAANAGFAVVRQPVCEPEAWSKVRRLGLDGCGRATGVMIASTKKQSHRCIGESRGLRTRYIARHASFAVFIGEPGIPAQPQIERQARSDAPIVLDERAPLDAGKVQVN